jgi:hypothetical protein
MLCLKKERISPQRKAEKTFELTYNEKNMNKLTLNTATNY